MRNCPVCGGQAPAGADYCPMDGSYLGETSARPTQCLDPLLGVVVDRRYRVDALVGEGGMARVYRVTHTLIGRTLAIKVLRAELQRDRALVERFLQEARCASAVKHPNVVELCDYGELPDGGAFYVMEFLRGCTLAERIDREGPLPPEEALTIALQVCCGLEAIHEQGIIHRDLKAENVFLCPDSRGSVNAKVLDFGIAKGGALRLTAAGAILGTPEYMSPEQALGQEADARSDLYSLGVLVFEMLTGFVPFASEDVALTLESLIRAEPPRLRTVRTERTSMLIETEQVLLALMAKDRSQRISSATIARDELQRALIADLGHDSAARVRSTLRIGSNRVVDRPRPAAGEPPSWNWHPAPGEPRTPTPGPTTHARGRRRRYLRSGQTTRVVMMVAMATALSIAAGYAWFAQYRAGIHGSSAGATPAPDAALGRPLVTEPTLEAPVTQKSAALVATPTSEISADRPSPAFESRSFPLGSSIPASGTAATLSPTGRIKRPSPSFKLEPTPAPVSAPPDEGLALPTVDTPTVPLLPLDEPFEVDGRTNSAGDLRDPFFEK